jgi:exodeoxyribonuclease-1
LEAERYLTDQMTGDGSGCLTFDQAMAETEKLLGEAAGSDDLLIHYRAYLQDRRARLEAYRARLVA